MLSVVVAIYILNSICLPEYLTYTRKNNSNNSSHLKKQFEVISTCYYSVIIVNF